MHRKTVLPTSQNICRIMLFLECLLADVLSLNSITLSNMIHAFRDHGDLYKCVSLSRGGPESVTIDPVAGFVLLWKTRFIFPLKLHPYMSTYQISSAHFTNYYALPLGIT